MSYLRFPIDLGGGWEIRLEPYASEREALVKIQAYKDGARQGLEFNRLVPPDNEVFEQAATDLIASVRAIVADEERIQTKAAEHAAEVAKFIDRHQR